MDQSDPSFMYSQILKEILLIIDFEDKHITEFINYYRGTLAKDYIDSRTIEELEGYRNQEPIWWYSSKCYLYLKLNEALRLA
ncbi:unnamed protein product [Adineta steineri]|uniref:Uncharacterized protein n=1 Tax=Adineta steineri TaxID=433720 RepID=A0A813MC97_9BILA|nr:unnamed protein product [Adineta steineri]CAF0769868.1 unnamed protein product [Adineta steineri]CAF0772515.1 unnamed protein product [Adineta steineri]CAF3547534.1 unnamed protein product [Adineta steineri]CAF3656059.1 unnamed protein product [Adineta steineri]